MAGRGCTLIATLVVLGVVHSVAATTYVVSQPGTNGGSWNFLTGNSSDYDDIFKNTKLFVGDRLSFTFASDVHDVREVTPAALASCDSSNSIETYTASVNVTLKTAGEHGFICSYPSHCSSYGMHLLVTVLDAPASPPAEGGSEPQPGASGNAASFLRSGSAMIVGALIAACGVLAL